MVYSATWAGAARQIFTVRTDSPVSIPIELSNAGLLGVSSKGELAVSIDKGAGLGTLGRVPLTGGTPRELLENVMRADWAPNGEDLAVLRYVDGRFRLEYPIGTTLYESANTLQYVRVSPNGELVAFLERGDLTTVDRKGQRRVVSSGWEGPYFAWSPRGDEILMSGSRWPKERAVYAVSLSGRERVVMSNSHGLALHDVASDGRLLVEDWREHDGIACLPKGEKRERDLGWMFASTIRRISDDGRFILFINTQGTTPAGFTSARQTGHRRFGWAKEGCRTSRPTVAGSWR